MIKITHTVFDSLTQLYLRNSSAKMDFVEVNIGDQQPETLL